MGRLLIVLSVLWIVACAFVFLGAAPLGFVVFGLVPVAILWAIRILSRLTRRRQPPLYYGPL